MRVRLINATVRPLDNVAAAARSCYSPTLVTAEQVAADHADSDRKERALERRDRLARSVLEAGHLTTWQHAYFQFAIEGISRHALWCFLHAHPFYNSEQVSQRYVTVSREAVYVPSALKGAARERYLTAVDEAHTAYRELTALLEPAVESRLLAARPAWSRPAHHKKLKQQRRRGAQEVARYVLPLATTAHLHHTVSALTLLRYCRLPWHEDAPEEIRDLVGAMVAEVLKAAPELEKLIPEPVEQEPGPLPVPSRPREFRREFDAALGAGTTRLLDGAGSARRTIGSAVRAVLARTESELPDDEAVRLALDPSSNHLLADTLNLSTVDAVSRAAQQARMTFATRLSHTADSQNQRHRMVPGARPVLLAATDTEPDFVVPSLIGENTTALQRYVETMERAWGAVDWIRRNGPAAHLALYLLPNATAVRIVESGDLAAIQHKMRMRLCWNAQEEIRRIAWEQATQVAGEDPLLGSVLLPPCSVRRRAGVTPYCPEGDRFCGTPVWKLSLDRQEPPSPTRPPSSAR